MNFSGTGTCIVPTPWHLGQADAYVEEKKWRGFAIGALLWQLGHVHSSFRFINAPQFKQTLSPTDANKIAK